MANACLVRERPRFQKPSERPSGAHMDAWAFPLQQGTHTIERTFGLTYKGLFLVKPPFDLASYSRLIWELQPRTIIELGTLQGGSAVWLADQGTVLCKEPPMVYSLDFYTALRSPEAVHPRVKFLEADLLNLEASDWAFLKDLPTPWLVIDDAHVNIMNVFRLFDSHMSVGDYYVMEDLRFESVATAALHAKSVEECGYMSRHSLRRCFRRKRDVCTQCMAAEGEKEEQIRPARRTTRPPVTSGSSLNLNVDSRNFLGKGPEDVVDTHAPRGVRRALAPSSGGEVRERARMCVARVG